MRNDTCEPEAARSQAHATEGERGSDKLEQSSRTKISKPTLNVARRDRLLAWINDKGALFNHGGKQCVLIDGRGVTDFGPNCAVVEYILINALGISSEYKEARDAIKFLKTWIFENAPVVTGAVLAMALPGRIYVPVAAGLLRIRPSGVQVVRNILNEDSVWVTHPRGRAMAVDPATYAHLCRDGLLAIEKTIVLQMSVQEPAMAWFSTVNGLWAPFLRQMFGARFIAAHVGPSQAGKTTAAQLLLDALDLGTVIGDCSTAGLYAHDFGLLVLDNMESENWNPGLMQFALHAATGARRIRGSRHGAPTESSFDEIVVLTSIEGAPRVELRERIASIEFRKSGQCFSRHEASSAVVAARESIHAAIVGTLQRYLANAPHPPGGEALRNFRDHYSAIRAVMRCIGQLLERPKDWAEEMIKQWDQSLLAAENVERRSDELEVAILNAVRRLKFQNISFRGESGRLFICSATDLCSAMGAKSPSALGRRLRGAEFESLHVLTEAEARTVPALQRTERNRKLGIFVPHSHDGLFGPPMLLPVEAELHPHLDPSDRCHYLFDYHARDENPGLLSTLKLPADAHLSDRQFQIVQEIIASVRWFAPPHWADALIVPIPNAAGSPTQVLRIMEGVGMGTVLPIIGWDVAMTPRAKGIAPESLARHITLDDLSVEREPERIVLVDDVLSTGGHFRAASVCLKERFPHALIEGLFIFRNASGRSTAAGAGSF